MSACGSSRDPVTVRIDRGVLLPKLSTEVPRRSGVLRTSPVSDSPKFNDEVNGGEGRDQVDGGPGSDDLNGDDGNDFLDSVDRAGDDTVNCGTGSDDVAADRGDTVRGNCESVKRFSL